MANEYEINIGADPVPVATVQTGSPSSPPSVHEEAAFHYFAEEPSVVTRENSSGSVVRNPSIINGFSFPVPQSRPMAPQQTQKAAGEYDKMKKRKEKKKLKSLGTEWRVEASNVIGNSCVGKILEFLGEDTAAETEKVTSSGHSKKSKNSSSQKSRSKVTSSSLAKPKTDHNHSGHTHQENSSTQSTNGFLTKKLSSTSSSEATDEDINVNNSISGNSTSTASPTECSPVMPTSSDMVNGSAQTNPCTAVKEALVVEEIPSMMCCDSTSSNYHLVAASTSNDLEFKEVNHRKKRGKDNKCAGADRDRKSKSTQTSNQPTGKRQPSRVSKQTGPPNGGSLPKDHMATGKTSNSNTDTYIDLSSTSFPALGLFNSNRRRTSAGDLKSIGNGDLESASVTDDDRDSVKSQPISSLANKQSWAIIAASQTKQSSTGSSNMSSSMRSADNSSSLSYRSSSPSSINTAEAYLESVDLRPLTQQQQSLVNSVTASATTPPQLYNELQSTSSSYPVPDKQPQSSQRPTSPICSSEGQSPTSTPPFQSHCSVVSNHVTGAAPDVNSSVNTAAAIRQPSVVEFGTVINSDDKITDQQVLNILSKSTTVPKLTAASRVPPTASSSTKIAAPSNKDTSQARPPAALRRPSQSSTGAIASIITRKDTLSSSHAAVEFLDKPGAKNDHTNVYNLTFGFGEIADVSLASGTPSYPAPTSIAVDNSMTGGQQLPAKLAATSSSSPLPNTHPPPQSSPPQPANTGMFDLISAVRMLRREWDQTCSFLQKQASGKRSEVKVLYIKSTEPVQK